MKESKYEKYVVRKPAIVKDGKDEVPETYEIPLRSPIDTGPLVIFSKNFVEESNSIVEYGIISGDITIGAGGVPPPHKHDYEELFIFLGTDPKNVRDLGAEVDFWIGEGADKEKITFSTSSSIYIPPGVVHFPQIWRNVRRPVMMVVIMPSCGKRAIEPVAPKDITD